jgi:hypothetical protein
MANPKLDPIAWLMQVELNPDNPTFDGLPADAVKTIDDELERLRIRQEKLMVARASISRLR